MDSKIPLDLGLCAVFTDARSGERTPTGAVRRGLRPSPHRSRGAADRNTDSVHGHLGPGCLTPSGEREQRRVGDRRGRPGRASGQTGPAAPSGGVGDGDPLERSTISGRPVVGERCGETTGRARHPRVAGDLAPSGGRNTLLSGGVWQRRRGIGAGGTGATPTGPSEVDSVWHQDRGLGQPGQREAVPRVRDRETGVESETRHRPPRRKARRAM